MSVATLPSGNIAPSPGYPSYCQSAPSGASCQTDAINALNHARAAMGLPAYSLPANFQSLDALIQFLVLSNQDRASYGLTQITGLNATLNAAAAAGVAGDTDPVGPAVVDGNHFTAWTSNWAAGWASPLYTYYEWMYDDGYGSSNVDCTSPSAAGCWGHRRSTLNNFGSAQVLMGAAAGTSPHYGQPAFAELYEGFAPSAVLSSAGYTPANITPGWATESVSNSQAVYRIAAGSVYSKRYATSTGWAATWTNIGAPASSVSAVGTPIASVFQGQDQVFVTGSDGGVYVRSYTASGGWSASWVALGLPAPGVKAAGDPTVLSTSSTGNDNVYVRGTDGKLYQEWYTPGYGWSSSWYNLATPAGVSLASDPATGSFSGIDQVYAVGSDGSLWQRWYTPGHGWSDGWYSLAAPAGTKLVARPAAGVFGGVDQVYTTGANGAVYQRWYTPGYGWSDGWYSLGAPAAGVKASGSLAVSPFSVTANDDLYVRGNDGNLYEQWYTPGHGWSSFWFNLAAPGGSTLTVDPASGNFAGNDEVYSAGPNGTVYQRWYTPGNGWSGGWYSVGPPQ